MKEPLMDSVRLFSDKAFRWFCTHILVCLRVKKVHLHNVIDRKSKHNILKIKKLNMPLTVMPTNRKLLVRG